MSQKRRATKEDERELKSKVSFFIVILMVLSLTVCNMPKTQETPAANETQETQVTNEADNSN